MLLTVVQLQSTSHLGEVPIRQGDPISAFLFVLPLEVLFILRKSKPETEGMTIFDYNYYIYKAYD